MLIRMAGRQKPWWAAVMQMAVAVKFGRGYVLFKVIKRLDLSKLADYLSIQKGQWNFKSSYF